MFSFKEIGKIKIDRYIQLICTSDAKVVGFYFLGSPEAVMLKVEYPLTIYMFDNINYRYKIKNNFIYFIHRTNGNMYMFGSNNVDLVSKCDASLFINSFSKEW